MTGDLRSRIAAALDECRTLTPDAQASAVMAVVEPALHRARHYVRGRCRYCGARDGDTWPEPMRKPHAMSCPLYVGPLEHRAAGRSEMFIGEANNCSCGRWWRDEEGGCPEAAIDWRGPKPENHHG